MPEQPPDRSADAVVRAITRGEVDTYADLRAHALVESPWEFTNAPSEDRTPDQVRASLDPAINAIIGVFVLHAKSGAVPCADTCAWWLPRALANAPCLVSTSPQG